MNIESVREYALSLQHVEERQPFGPDYIVFEIGGKMFLMLMLDDRHNTFYNVKVSPGYGVYLREHYEGVRPAWHMNKVHWLSIDYTTELSDDMQRDIIRQAYELVFASLPRVRRQTLM